MPLYNENQMIESAPRQDICREDLRNSGGRHVYSNVIGHAMRRHRLINENNIHEN